MLIINSLIIKILRIETDANIDFLAEFGLPIWQIGWNSRIIIETRSSDGHRGIRRVIAITFHFLFFLFSLFSFPGKMHRYTPHCFEIRGDCGAMSALLPNGARQKKWGQLSSRVPRSRIERRCTI